MKTPYNPAARWLPAIILAAGLFTNRLEAGFSAPGHGLTNVLSGSLPNAGLFWQTSTNWINGAPPAKPYALTNHFTLPVGEAIALARLATTVWGGAASYSSEFTVTVNNKPLAGANPLVFGTTSDANAMFSPSIPSVYGAGSGLWLVMLPVPGDLLFTDGTSNTVVITQTTPDSFDGRIHHVTLFGVYQSSTLQNQFDYAIAEGSGDLYRAPSAIQTDHREFALTVNPTNATAAVLQALYTYGDPGQNDRLYFNRVQLGSDDVATWDKAGSGFDYGPSRVTFDVLPWLAETNDVLFTVASSDVPDTRESSLRPQLAMLAVTRAPVPVPSPPELAVATETDRLLLTVSGEVGRAYTILTSTNLTHWPEWHTFVNTNAISSFSVPLTNEVRFFRVRTF